ncbi:MAG: nucleoside triphosphate pyrophosphohydrolase [Chthoniobacteraceae bacterium]
MTDAPLPKTAADALDPRFSPLDQLLRVMARLRAPDGCPWDREQTHATLRAAVIEEAYEVAAAISSGDDDNLREELGDLLLQVVFHAQMARERGSWDFDTVATGIVEKLVRRHPHVFGSESAADSGAVLKRWEEIKREEKGAQHDSLLNGISEGLPGLLRAEKAQKRAAKVGFDWNELPPVIAKIREELGEVEAVLSDPQKVEDEIGDLLFSVVNLARKLKVDGEVALQKATDKFSSRFRKLEAIASERDLPLERMSLAELDAIWDEVKASK